MDEAGLDVQVISLTSPGLHSLPADHTAGLQVETNDRIAALVNAHPDRFQGFATLAMPAADAAAQELERAVTKLGLNGALIFGRSGERNLDHPDNWPIFENAASLRAPLYPRHRLALRDRRAVPPARPRRPVRPLPDLQVLLGHWGEVVLFYLHRADGLALQAGLPATFSEHARGNSYITAGGVYSQRYLHWAVEVVGVERILFATDYPYRTGSSGGVEHFLQASGLDGAAQERIAAGNWDAIVGGIRR